MATYTIVAVARTPTINSGPTLVELGPVSGSLSYTDILNEAGTASINVSVESLQDDIKSSLRDLVAFPLEIWVYRDSQIVFAGPLIGGEIADGILSLDVRSLEFYPAYMLITADKVWAAVDLATIVEEIINDWQALDYGDYGIETATVGTIGNTRTQNFPAATEPVSVYEFLLENAGQDNGFDWRIDPTTRELEVWSVRGSDLSESVFLELGVTSSAIRFTVAPGAIGSDVFAIGTGPDLTNPLSTTKTNASLQSSFGRSGLALSADPVEDATHLGDVAQALLDERDSVFFVPGPALIPVSGADIPAFDTGDFITYTFDAGLGQVTGTYRVVKRTVSVADNGQETMTVEFA